MAPGSVAAQTSPAPEPSDPLVPVPTLSAPNGPTVLRLPAAAPGIVALRVSVPIDEAEIEAGTGQVIASLARARIPGLVAPLGVEAEVTRTPWGIAYTVAGPGTDFDYLAYVLRELTAQPDLARVGEARVLLRNTQVRRQETGRGRVELRLREATSLTRPPLLGTPGTIEALSPSGVRELWLRTHRPERMTILVSGDVSTPLLLASLDRLGTTEAPASAPTDVPVPAGPSPDRLDLIRTAAGVAWSRPEPLSPEVAVSALLLTDVLRTEDPGFEARVLLWESAGRSTLALIGAAFPRDLRELRGWLDTGLDELANRLDDAGVRAVADDLRADVLFEARTAVGQVSLVGRFLDAGLGADGLRRYVTRLTELDAGSLSAVLAEMSAGNPARAEVTR